MRERLRDFGQSFKVKWIITSNYSICPRIGFLVYSRGANIHPVAQVKNQRTTLDFCLSLTPKPISKFS